MDILCEEQETITQRELEEKTGYSLGLINKNMKIFGPSEKDLDQFSTYYERKRNRKYSLFGAVKEAYGIILIMLAGLLPALLFPLYMEILGL